MTYRQELKSLLSDWGPGHVMKTAYDTAWIASLGDLDLAMSDAALNWICENQLPDGSWGASAPFYYHDRVISTIAAMIALNFRDKGDCHRHQVDLGLHFLERIADRSTQSLMDDPGRATVGYEMIAPTLVTQAESLGILDHQGGRILGRLKTLREAKLSRLQDFRINRALTVAYSSEMAGPDNQHLLDLPNLQEANGSVAYSPSATAYFARQVCPGDTGALSYLRQIVSQDGGAPMAAPFDIYERAWVLWNLALTGSLDRELEALCQPHLDALQVAWNERCGVGFGTGYSVQDGDDTSLVYAVFNSFGRQVDINAVYHYEEPDFFRCYALEANPSISANVHILDVFSRVGLKASHPGVQKILRFLRDNQRDGKYWLDKWHASPYYTTTHIVLACQSFAPTLAETAVRWILDTRNPDGSWGYYMPTAEETAYALQALCIWNRQCGAVPRELIRQSAIWLEDHAQPPYQPLWIAKSLYYSEWVVRAEILSALILAAQN